MTSIKKAEKEVWWRELMDAWAKATSDDDDAAMDFFNEWLTDLEDHLS